jgi:hypothetical protein
MVVFMVVLMDELMDELMEDSSTELFHFFLGLEETRLQGVEVSFQVLATSMLHEDG